MSEQLPFVEIVRRVRAGDEEASTELVRRYGTAIRVAVHARLSDPGLRRVLDTMDICQSVMGNFFARASSGEFEIETPEQLINLLITMARNRLIDHALHHQAARRDYRRNSPAPVENESVVDPSPSPSEQISGQELLERFRDKLRPAERYLADERALGRPWAELARELETTQDALRVQLARAVERVKGELHLEP